MTGAIAAQLVLSLRRQRTFLALLVTLLVMTALAGVIGWISHRTIIKVYDEAVTLLATTGTPAPPNPFDTKPTLALLSNMVIYIPLIGALMALVLGHLSMADDQSSGIGRLIFSRQVTRRSYVTGKMLGATTVLAIIMAASLLVSAVSLLIVNGALTAGRRPVKTSYGPNTQPWRKFLGGRQFVVVPAGPIGAAVAADETVTGNKVNK